MSVLPAIPIEHQKSLCFRVSFHQNKGFFVDNCLTRGMDEHATAQQKIVQISNGILIDVENLLHKSDWTHFSEFLIELRFSGIFPLKFARLDQFKLVFDPLSRQLYISMITNNGNYWAMLILEFPTKRNKKKEWILRNGKIVGFFSRIPLPFFPMHLLKLKHLRFLAIHLKGTHGIKPKKKNICAKNLSVLSIHYGYNSWPEDLDWISRFKHLNKLTLSICQRQYRKEFHEIWLDHFKRLAVVSLSSVSLNFKPRKYTSLKRITISDSILNFNGAIFPALKFLHMDGCSTLATDLSCHAPNLRKLTLKNMKVWQDFGISHLYVLQKLTLDTVTIEKPILPPKLKSLYVSNIDW